MGSKTSPVSTSSLAENRQRDASPNETNPVPLASTLRTAGVWFALWIAPLVLPALLFGRDHVLTDIAIFFSKLAWLLSAGPIRCSPIWRKLRSRPMAGSVPEKCWMA